AAYLEKKWVKCSIKIQNSGLKCKPLGDLQEYVAVLPYRDDQLWIQALIFFQTLRDWCFLYGKFMEVGIREEIYCREGVVYN
ncbi:hypothetical protein BpHYR1_052082, partial [Brachionus plicatilis]